MGEGGMGGPRLWGGRWEEGRQRAKTTIGRQQRGGKWGGGRKQGKLA